jgi:hypothetical protein
LTWTDLYNVLIALSGFGTAIVPWLGGVMVVRALWRLRHPRPTE